MTSITTEAYVVHENDGPFELETVHYSDVGEHELLIEAVAVSLCHTDIIASSGAFMMKPPIIPGHEGSGIGRCSTHQLGMLCRMVTIYIPKPSPKFRHPHLTKTQSNASAPT